MQVLNWRPQLLILYKLEPISLAPKYPRIFSIASQLKAGRGFTVSATMLHGDLMELESNIILAKQLLRSSMLEEDLNGFCKILATRNPIEAINIL